MKKIDKYEIIEEIGRGGFAVVYKAHDPTLNRAVVLKVLATHLTWDSNSAERFRRKAQATAKPDHPHIVTIYEVGKAKRLSYIGIRVFCAQSYLLQLSIFKDNVHLCDQN